MSRKNYILFLLAVLIFNACQKEPEFEYQMVTPNTGDIESIRFSPGHHVLVANGENELNMVVDVYRKYKHTYLDGTVTDTLVLVDPTTFLPGNFKIIHEETGQEVKDLTFSTTDYSNGVATFHAEVGDIVSESKSVELRAPQELPEKRIVDVIFHVFNLSPNDPQYNIFKEAEVTPDLLQAAIDDLNGVFNKAYSKSASSASANIEFRLASKDASGQTLENPGLHAYSYSYDMVGGDNNLVLNFISIVNKNTDLFIWDPDRYANVIVLPASMNYYLYIDNPQAQIVPVGESTMAGMGSKVADENSLPSVFKKDPYKAYCVSTHKGVFFPGENKRISVLEHFGKYWGLKRVVVSSPTTTDYCKDTRKYYLYEPDETGKGYDIRKPQIKNIVRMGWDGYRFKCNNLMDDLRYATLRNTITGDQVERVRYALDNCPGRRPDSANN